jgi:hypothetical protein
LLVCRCRNNPSISLSQPIQPAGGKTVQDTAESKADERHDEALNPGFRELKKSRRHEAGDERSYAQIAEERCSEFQPFVVHQI